MFSNTSKNLHEQNQLTYFTEKTNTMKRTKSSKAAIGSIFISLSFLIAALFGEVRCIVKAVNCNWEPVGKAEIVYTASALTGVGVVVGYFNIEDK